jgi:hypothetical protein
VTVGVFWTKAARLGSNGGQEAGSEEEIRRQLRRMAWLASVAFNMATKEAGSPFQVHLNWKLVKEVDYQESGDDETDLVRLRDRLNDGFLDDIPRLRHEGRYDVAVLVLENLDTGGLAAVMSEDTKDTFVSWAYAVVERDSGLNNFNFGHEIGHLFGCGHGVGDSGMFDYSAGWHFSTGVRDYHTVMAYRDHEGERPYNAFSNPRKSTSGAAWGQEGVADHARTIQATMQIITRLK